VKKPAAPPGGPVNVVSTYYMPDPLPQANSQTVTQLPDPSLRLSRRGLEQLYQEHADFGGLRVLLRNNGPAAVRINNVVLNDRPIETHYVDFVKSAWDARGVVWYRIRPQTLEHGQCGQVYVRFRRRPAGAEANVSINFENCEPVRVAIPYETPPMAIDYVTTGPVTDKLYVYVRRDRAGQPGKPIQMSLDGEPIAKVKFYGSDFPGGVALGLAQLPKPLKTLSYHVVEVKTDTGTTIGAQFRVLPFMFPRSSIHVSAELCGEMNMNLAMWHMQSLETCEKFDIYTTTGSIFNAHRRVAFILGPDEPDCKDNRGGGLVEGLGYHARQLAESGWQELIQRFAGQAASWIIMDGAAWPIRPLNWFVYGQVADIACYDPYTVTWYNADHAFGRESLELVRLSARPNRMFGCMEAYGWGSGQGVPGGARGPIPAEYRQNIVQALGVGMKGLTSWVHSAGAGGWEINQPCKEEIAKLNKIIELIETELLLATPVDLAASDAGVVPTGSVGHENWPKPRVWVGSLLSGPDTIILAAANHIPASKPDPPTIERARDVTITVTLPDFLRRVKAAEVTENGIVPFDCSVVSGKVALKLSEIESGRVFILRRK